MELTVFEFEDKNIRTMLIDNEPYFVGKDIAETLGYKRTADAIRTHVDEEDKGVGEIQTPGGKQVMTVINESGLYALIFNSKLSSAKHFKRWVTSEVLPTIRKHGAYMTEEKLEEVLLNPETIIQLAQQLKDEREQRLIAEQRVMELQPKASYYDTILQNKSTVSVSQIAKDYGKSAKWLNNKLHELGVQYKQGDTWLLYQKYAEKGYTQSSTFAIDANRNKMFTKWRPKGRLFIYELLKDEGILPLIELESA